MVDDLVTYYLLNLPLEVFSGRAIQDFGLRFLGLQGEIRELSEYLIPDNRFPSNRYIFDKNRRITCKYKYWGNGQIYSKTDYINFQRKQRDRVVFWKDNGEFRMETKDNHDHENIMVGIEIKNALELKKIDFDIRIIGDLKIVKEKSGTISFYNHGKLLRLTGKNYRINYFYRGNHLSRTESFDHGRLSSTRKYNDKGLLTTESNYLYSENLEIVNDLEKGLWNKKVDVLEKRQGIDIWEQIKILEYDEKNRLMRVSYIMEGKKLNKSTYDYDSNGYLVSENHKNSRITYSYLKFDELGNWILQEQNHRSFDQQKTQNVFTVRRKFKYYE